MFAYVGLPHNQKDTKDPGVCASAILWIDSHTLLRTTLYTLAASHLHWRAGSSGSFDANRKEAGHFCDSFLLKHVFFAYVWRNQSLKDPQLSFRKDGRKQGCSADGFYGRAMWWPMLGEIKTLRTYRGTSLQRPPPRTTLGHSAKAYVESWGGAFSYQ